MTIYPYKQINIHFFGQTIIPGIDSGITCVIIYSRSYNGSSLTICMTLNRLCQRAVLPCCAQRTSSYIAICFDVNGAVPL